MQLFSALIDNIFSCETCQMGFIPVRMLILPILYVQKKTCDETSLDRILLEQLAIAFTILYVHLKIGQCRFFFNC